MKKLITVRFQMSLNLEKNQDFMRHEDENLSDHNFILNYTNIY